MNCALVDEGSIGSEVGEEPCGKTLTYTSKWLMNMIFKLTHRDKIFAPSAKYKWDEMGPLQMAKVNVWLWLFTPL